MVRPELNTTAKERVKGMVALRTLPSNNECSLVVTANANMFNSGR